jgi:predicted aspartyl protease
MTETFQNILYLVAAGVLLFAGVFMLRFILKLAWKVIRLAMIVLSLLLIAGYFLGFLDIALR